MLYNQTLIIIMIAVIVTQEHAVIIHVVQEWWLVDLTQLIYMRIGHYNNITVLICNP